MRTLALLVLLASPATAGENPITIRGLNLDSTPEEFEATLGPCIENKKCGSSPEVFFIHCSFINGCDYSASDFRDLLIKGLGLTAEGKGPAGDLLTVADAPEGPYLSVYVKNYRKPALLLD